ELKDNELIVNIISIGKREDFTAYLQAYLRIK
ncbi:MAG TPA: type II toxin-antitoxin system mRNA interferase toxin, RelE/StbE family, partial [Actinobacteria bacterium]|nr:type II toxin-antitoxin system mRNA interferase toxin, RelE/StbE family [Actinomycetota bacterium]